MARRLETGGMTPVERRAALTLSTLYAVRMLGLFLILPVFALHAEALQGATSALVGLAIGIYGLTQAALQIPFGLLSDRLGRKRVIVAGLLLFAAGSVVAAASETIAGVIAGRALQGTGAIAAATMALAADLSREEHRTKVMAVIGASIGLAFALAMVLGPVLAEAVGVSGIFWLTAGLALGAIVLVLLAVPDPVHSRVHRDASPVPALFRRILGDAQLLRLDLGIFVLHMLLTATFVVTPLALRDAVGLAADRHWELYLAVMVLSVLAMLPFVFIAERHRRMKPVFLGAILVLALTELGLAGFHDTLAAMAVLLFAFFTSFNLLEASLPSLVSKMCPPDAKGTAMGVYSTSQFLGAFAGGAAGGWIQGHFGFQGVFAFAALGAVVWFLVAATMKNPRYLSSYLLNLGRIDDHQAREIALRLTQVRGVAEAVVIAADGVAYLKVERHALDEPRLLEFSAA